MNAAAKIYRTTDAALPIDRVLDVGGFNLRRAIEIDPAFMEPEYPFEWAGVYDLGAGDYSLVLKPGPDPSMDLVLPPLMEATQAELEAAQTEAVLLFSREPTPLTIGETILKRSATRPTARPSSTVARSSSVGVPQA